MSETANPDFVVNGLEQAMACMHCGLAGLVHRTMFPQPPGLSEDPCPRCGVVAVWATETREARNVP